MPILKENRGRYPKDWKLRSRFVRFYRAKNRCEWCGAENYKPHPITGSRVVLTVAHVYDDRPEASSLLNLAALCQRCHNRHDAKERTRRKREKRMKNQLKLFAAATAIVLYTACLPLVRTSSPLETQSAATSPPLVGGRAVSILLADVASAPALTPSLDRIWHGYLPGGTDPVLWGMAAKYVVTFHTMTGAAPIDSGAVLVLRNTKGLR